MSYNQIQYQIIQQIISNRVISSNDWESVGTKKRIRVRDKMKTLEERKKEKQ